MIEIGLRNQDFKPPKTDYCLLALSEQITVFLSVKWVQQHLPYKVIWIRWANTCKSS